jgi:hypothetical protein
VVRKCVPFPLVYASKFTDSHVACATDTRRTVNHFKIWRNFSYKLILISGFLIQMSMGHNIIYTETCDPLWCDICVLFSMNRRCKRENSRFIRFGGMDQFWIGITFFINQAINKRFKAHERGFILGGNRV